SPGPGVRPLSRSGLSPACRPPLSYGSGASARRTLLLAVYVANLFQPTCTSRNTVSLGRTHRDDSYSSVWHPEICHDLAMPRTAKESSHGLYGTALDRDRQVYRCDQARGAGARGAL